MTSHILIKSLHKSSKYLYRNNNIIKNFRNIPHLWILVFLYRTIQTRNMCTRIVCSNLYNHSPTHKNQRDTDMHATLNINIISNQIERR